MNKIKKIGNQKWEVICENGETFTCGEWFETKTGKWHVKLPLGNSTGRTYIRVEKLDPDKVNTFETKTEHREGLGWKDRMTVEERTTWAECEAKMLAIKKACESRVLPKAEKGTEEWYLNEIAKLTAKLEAKKAQK